MYIFCGFGFFEQVFLHFIRKSTEGWSIHSVFLDFTGGVQSFLQMGIDAFNNGCLLSNLNLCFLFSCTLIEFPFVDDWDGTYGNPGKLGLSIIAMIFDGIFMLQHFILYPGELHCPTKTCCSVLIHCNNVMC